MSVTVRIPTTLRSLAGGSSEVEVEGVDRRRGPAALDAAHPGFTDRLARRRRRPAPVRQRLRRRRRRPLPPGPRHPGARRRDRRHHPGGRGRVRRVALSASPRSRPRSARLRRRRRRRRRRHDDVDHDDEATTTTTSEPRRRRRRPTTSTHRGRPTTSTTRSRRPPRLHGLALPRHHRDASATSSRATASRARSQVFRPRRGRRHGPPGVDAAAPPRRRRRVAGDRRRQPRS